MATVACQAFEDAIESARHARGANENGRLTLEEPTDLPEGSVVPLEIAGEWDDLDDDERAELHDSLRQSIDQMNAGKKD